ncbi:MAG: (4Fe-4S)-binding protein [Ignavibacteriales bacterium]|nr:(4Fe-4S)-binding protein [Ignavibacteriales bacterium]
MPDIADNSTILNFNKQMDIKKEYSNGEITILWQASKCQHSANCIHGLPKVFNSTQSPWINIFGESTEKILETVSKCPSGALTVKEVLKSGSELKRGDAIQIVVSENGPINIKGNFDIFDSRGNKVKSKGSVSLCRCGGSASKPFCDGTHKKNNFQG